MEIRISRADFTGIPRDYALRACIGARNYCSRYFGLKIELFRHYARVRAALFELDFSPFYFQIYDARVSTDSSTYEMPEAFRALQDCRKNRAFAH
jgi:hypothetical protein